MREFHPERVPRPDLPLDLHAPFDLEIGAGQGLHAIQYAKSHPERRLLAIERTHTKYAQLARRCAQHPELAGIIPLQADAIAVVAHYVLEKSLERVFLLYPNPYPKAKHANLRWHNSPFMGFLRTRLKDGAELYMATNLQWYADEAKSAMQAKWGFHLERETKIAPQTPARSHFEKKYLARGEICYDLVFTRAAL